MKRFFLFLWGAHSHLVPIALILAGALLFIKFIPGYSGVLTFIWFLVVSYLYLKYNKWY